jgi:hypothetical protein
MFFRRRLGPFMARPLRRQRLLTRGLRVKAIMTVAASRIRTGRFRLVDEPHSHQIKTAATAEVGPALERQVRADIHGIRAQKNPTYCLVASFVEQR